MSEQNGDWYCRNCGYICNSRVTNSETCDACHIPVEWHTADEQGRIADLEQQVKALQYTKREVKLILNSVHERAMRLLDLHNNAGMKCFKSPSGKTPSIAEIDALYKGHEEHLRLVEKLKERLAEQEG